jgi:hypothetical protein
MMKTFLRLGVVALLLVGIAMPGLAQKKAGVVSDPAELKTILPTTFFFDGQSAPVQARNNAVIRLASGKFIVAALVDNSGYSSEVAQKYQGFFITEAPISVGKTALAPGQYGFGFTADGKFRIMDAAMKDVVLVPVTMDEALKRPQPLKATEDGAGFRLYAGKKYVTLTAK